MNNVTVFSHVRDTDGGMLLDIFDEKLHPLSVRPHQFALSHFAQIYFRLTLPIC